MEYLHVKPLGISPSLGEDLVATLQLSIHGGFNTQKKLNLLLHRGVPCVAARGRIEVNMRVRVWAVCVCMCVAVTSVAGVSRVARVAPMPPVPWHKQKVSLKSRPKPKANPIAKPQVVVLPPNQPCTLTVNWVDAGFQSPAQRGGDWLGLGNAAVTCASTCQTCVNPCYAQIGLLLMFSTGDPNDPSSYVPYGSSTGTGMWMNCDGTTWQLSIGSYLPGWHATYALQAVIYDSAGNQVAWSSISYITL